MILKLMALNADCSEYVHHLTAKSFGQIGILLLPFLDYSTLGYLIEMLQVMKKSCFSHLYFHLQLLR